MKKSFGFCLVFLLLVAAFGFSQTQVTYNCYNFRAAASDATNNSANLAQNVNYVILTSSSSSMLVTVVYKDGSKEELMFVNRKNGPSSSDNEAIWDVSRINSQYQTGLAARTTQSSTGALVMVYNKAKINPFGGSFYTVSGDLIFALALSKR